MQSTQILAYLDERFENYEFPCFSNMNIDYLTSRMSVYIGPDSSWIILFNSLVWWPAGEGLMGMIEIIGTGVEGKQGFDNDRITTPGIIECDDADQDIISIKVRNNPIDPKSLKIEPKYDLQPEIGFWAGVALLSGYRNLLLANEHELSLFIPKNYKLAVELDEWEHPDWGIPPSKTQTFIELSNALASCDFSIMTKCLKPNTYWSNWIAK